MTGPVRDTHAMIAGMAPRPVAGRWGFVTLTPDAAAPLMARARASFAEDEGLSLILPMADIPAGHTARPMRQITLGVASALDGVGLTAAVSAALAGAGIPCNMVAAHHHDHVFVPEEMADRALAVLLATAQEARG